MTYDLLVIGSGPAGVTASIYAARANKSVLVIEKEAFGGLITHSPKIENYPGFPSISGLELADQFISQAMNLGVNFEFDNIKEEAIIKCTSGSGENVFYNPEQKPNHKMIVRRMRYALRHNPYKFSREWNYIAPYFCWSR